MDVAVFSKGEGKLWVGFAGPFRDFEVPVPRFWNAFGVFDPKRQSQTITVEINIAVNSNTARVAGFFAEDFASGDTFLLHSGKVGGGRKGIGKSAFLVWSKSQLVEVAEGGGRVRHGILIGKLSDVNLQGRIWGFVKTVQGFKDAAAAGQLQTRDFKRQLEEFDRYKKEFSGKKRGVHGGVYEYVTYHGEIVQKLFEDRTARLSKGEKIFNSSLIDLFVKKDRVLSEVYEVKTGLGRQMIYTAIGQLVTHAVAGTEKVAKFLVIPTGEKMPDDLIKSIEFLGIKVRRFRLVRSGRDRVVELD